MRKRTLTDKQRQERKTKLNHRYYHENRDSIKEKQYGYRYQKSVQSYLDEKWNELHKKSNSMLFEWATKHGLGTSKSKMIAFWNAVKKNKADGLKVIKARINSMNNFNAKVKKKNVQ
jgi:hypothetical protein